jgi:hypothetical protein
MSSTRLRPISDPSPTCLQQFTYSYCLQGTTRKSSGVLDDSANLALGAIMKYDTVADEDDEDILVNTTTIGGGGGMEMTSELANSANTIPLAKRRKRKMGGNFAVHFPLSGRNKIQKIDNISKIQNVRYHILYFTIGWVKYKMSGRTKIFLIRKIQNIHGLGCNFDSNGRFINKKVLNLNLKKFKIKLLKNK